MPEQWMSIAEAAAVMKIHPRTVERRAAAGKVQSRRNDDGQVQVRIEVPDPEPIPPEPLSVEAFETVKEMADRQVDIAAGSASALVRAAQEQAMRAERQVEVHRQESKQYRREAQWAMAVVALVLLFLLLAVGYGTSTLTAARVEARMAHDRAVAAEATAAQAKDEARRAQDEVATAHAAAARAEGEATAYHSGVDAVLKQTRPLTFGERLNQWFAGK